MRIHVQRSHKPLVNAPHGSCGFRWNFEKKAYEVTIEAKSIHGKYVIVSFTDDELNAIFKARAERDEHVKNDPQALGKLEE